MAEQHGYRPHPAARELLTGERRTIGAIIPAISGVFFIDLMNVIRQRLAECGYRFFMTQTSDAAQFTAALQEFAAFRARAIVAVPPREPVEISSSIVGSTDVAVLINPCSGDRVTNFVPDEIETGRIAARYLFDRGHRTMLHIRPARNSRAIGDRANGFAEVLKSRDLSVLEHEYHEESIPAVVREKGITAIFCHNDWLALTTMRALARAGLRVPDDVSVLGVDDSPTFVSLCPDITTLHYPAESIAESVRAWIEGQTVPPVANVHVVERRTVAAM